MTNIEAKALALVNGVKTERGRNSYSHYTRLNRALDDGHEALCRAIEQHEAFKQNVSDAVEDTRFMVETHGDIKALILVSNRLDRFIIPKPKPDPLVEVLTEVDTGNGWDDEEDYARQIHKALAARGLEIREKNDD